MRNRAGDVARRLSGKALEHGSHAIASAARTGGLALSSAGQAALRAGMHGIKKTHTHARRLPAWINADAAVRAHAHIIMSIQAMLLSNKKVLKLPPDEIERLHKHERKEGERFAHCIASNARGNLTSCCPPSDDPFHYQACQQAAKAVAEAFEHLRTTFDGDDPAFLAYVDEHYSTKKVLRRFSKLKITAATVALLGALAGLLASGALPLPKLDGLMAKILRGTGVKKGSVAGFMSSIRNMSISQKLAAAKTFLYEQAPTLNLTRVKELTSRLAEQAGAHGKRLSHNTWEAAKHVGLRPWIEARENRDAHRIGQTTANDSDSDSSHVFSDLASAASSHVFSDMDSD